MEIFVHNLPFDLNSKKIRRGIVNAVKKAFRKRVEFHWQEFKSKGNGKLTFPTHEMGQKFLNEYKDGFPLHGHNGNYRIVRVSLSKYPPNDRLVEGLQRRMEERKLQQSDSEEEYSKSIDV